PLSHCGLGLHPHGATRAGGEVAMALGLPTDQRGQIMALLVLVALAGGYLFWTQVHKPTIEKIGAARSEADSLERIVAAAKADLASGSIEDLRRRVEEYQGSLELMRRLVPDRNEVPTLIDDISTKAKVRGVTLGKIQPLAPEPGNPFDTYRYRLEVFGHYDQIGEYLADIASLPRIVVPQDVTLSAATPAAQKLLADTAGALLLAEFSIRTFVKSAGPPPGQPKPGGARARS
ncbi:MAG TPA: type 4a pilus biogenesis protein PilO, partial [Gemmatimonadales bacterium]|nr:type 4a pilus biogenesis protein PilO [Gemmatimonadales bacterium]